MTLDPDHPALTELGPRLSPFVRSLLEAAAQRALELHADQVTVEHLVVATLAEESSGAVTTVEHAFADPESMGVEALALAPGIMVVGSGAAMPFSPRAVEALTAARDDAALSGEQEVSCGRVAARACEALSSEARAALDEAGLDAAGLAAASTDSATEGGAISREGTIFRSFSTAAKRALSRSARLAEQVREDSIGPAWLLVATLEEQPDLEERIGIRSARARAALARRTRDETPPVERSLSPDEALLGFLQRLPPGASSVGLLAACHHSSTSELSALLQRHKVTPELLARAEGAFEDPVEP